jgi:uncharacterized protein (DUF934 family)
MPRLIRDGAITEDTWSPLDIDSSAPVSGQVCSLEQWLQLANKNGSAVQLEPGDEVSALLGDLDRIALIQVNFPAFTDGRGFSYARELRERGFEGEIRAVGNFIRDQLTYLVRVGFNAFQLADESGLEASLASLKDFNEHYQAAIDQPLPLFRRRA